MEEFVSHDAGDRGGAVTEGSIERERERKDKRDSAVSKECPRLHHPKVNGKTKIRRKKADLNIFISCESPAQLGREGGFPDSSLAAEYEDFPFNPRQPLVDHQER